MSENLISASPNDSFIINASKQHFKAHSCTSHLLVVEKDVIQKNIFLI